jgi:hypothetical protein
MLLAFVPLLSAAPTPSLVVRVPDDSDGFVEIRPLLGDVWTGSPIAVAAVVGARTKVPLPMAQAASPTEFVVALRAADADGEPGIDTGEAEMRLVCGPSGWALRDASGGDHPISDGLLLKETAPTP